MIITSVNNELVKETSKLLQTKYRKEKGLFLLEGNKCIEEAIASGLEVVHIFSKDGFENYPQRIETTDAVLSKISDAKTPPKAVAVAKMPEYDSLNLKGMQRVVLLEGIKDAGNLGTIIRTATAFDIDAIVLYGNTVDIYNPKCVRASVGNLWKIPVIELKDLSAFDEFERVATLPNGNNVIGLKGYMPKEKVLIMFGSEADGLSDELKKSATKNVTIEMSDNVESLNLSISVGIILYKIK